MRWTLSFYERATAEIPPPSGRAVSGATLTVAAAESTCGAGKEGACAPRRTGRPAISSPSAAASAEGT